MRYTLTDDVADDNIKRYPFGDRLTGSFDRAAAEAQELANANGAPVGIWTRDGWFTVCEVPGDCLEPSPESMGWQDWALVEPAQWEA